MRGDQHKPRWERECSIFPSLKKQLNSSSCTGLSLLLVFFATGLGAANYLVQPSDIHLAPLFMLPICVAAWHTGLRVALTVAVISAMISVGSDIKVSLPAPQDMAGNLMIHTVSFAIVAVTVWRFRASYEEQRFVARHDRVTGILNRQAFEQEAQAMLSVACREGWPMLLVYLDLDGFKSINDRYGHEAGDEVLRRFGIEGRLTLRCEDCFGRMGGDEFALLMKLPTLDEGQRAAEMLHRRFSAALTDTGHAATCSMGALAVLPDVGSTHMDELMRSVDRLMYAAKHGGKDDMRYTTSSRLRDEDLMQFTGSEEMAPIFSRSNRDAATAVRSL